MEVHLRVKSVLRDAVPWCQTQNGWTPSVCLSLDCILEFAERGAKLPEGREWCTACVLAHERFHVDLELGARKR